MNSPEIMEGEVFPLNILDSYLSRRCYLGIDSQVILAGEAHPNAVLNLKVLDQKLRYSRSF